MFPRDAKERLWRALRGPTARLSVSSLSRFSLPPPETVPASRGKSHTPSLQPGLSTLTLLAHPFAFLVHQAAGSSPPRLRAATGLCARNLIILRRRAPTAIPPRPCQTYHKQAHLAEKGHKLFKEKRYNTCIAASTLTIHHDQP